MTDDPAAAIAAALRSNMKKVMDLFREWDVNGDGAVSKKEFKNAMATLRIEVTAEGVDAPALMPVLAAAEGGAVNADADAVHAARAVADAGRRFGAPSGGAALESKP